jgi:nitronate monooxygenase
MWPDKRILDLFGIEHPILLGPMAGTIDYVIATEVAEGGGLGSIPCAMLTPDTAREQIANYRERTSKPLNVNFFCHTPPTPDNVSEASWRDRLRPYYVEFGLDPNAPVNAVSRSPFDDAFCALMEETRPEVISFHFGLPPEALLTRVKAIGSKIISSATTAAEARWLEQRGVDAVIAQGNEAGGHRGIFLSDNPAADISKQPGTFALVPQVVDSVKVPVIAAGGIADGRGIAAAFALGASAVQIGTAFLHCPESKISPMHRKALAEASDDSTVLTNLFTGRPARGIVNRLIRQEGPIAEVPPFPLATAAVGPLRTAAEKAGSGDFSPLWSGQAPGLGSKGVPAADLTRQLAADGLARIKAIAG